MSGLMIPGLGALLPGLGSLDDAADPAPGGSLPADLGAAIGARLLGNRAIVEAFPGGIHRNRAGGQPDGPYLVFKVLSARPTNVTSSSAWLDTRIRFGCFAEDADLAADARALVVAEFAERPIEHARGRTTPAFELDAAEDEAPRAAPGTHPYRAQVDFRAYDHLRRG